MALKKQRDSYAVYDVRHKITQNATDNNAVAGAGVCYSTAASGDGVGSLAVATVAASQSGQKPLGMLMHDMEKANTSDRWTPNQWDMSQVAGNAATIMRKGWAVTNVLFGTPAAGDPCYLHGTGYHSNTQGVGGVIDTPRVGEFMTIKDENGYAKIYYNLPMTQK